MWYVENDVDLRTATRVDRIALDTQRVHTVDGDSVGYDRLLIATGSRPRRLPTRAGSMAQGGALEYLRTLTDSLKLRQRLTTGRRVVLIGGGWIVMEVAAAARLAGCEVVVLVRGDLPLEGPLGPAVARAFTRAHRRHGVEVRSHVEVVTVDADDERATVVLSDGTTMVADLVVAGVGAIPNTDLAGDAGLRVTEGIDCDQFLRTESPGVYVAGDVANAYNPRYGRRLRVEHWDNARRQGDLVAANMVGDEPVPYDRPPYFFTDQFELGMEFIGYLEPGREYQSVARGELSSDHYSFFWLLDGRVAAGMHVNEWDNMNLIRRLVDQAPRVPASVLSDPQAELEELLPAATP
jgi:3-phenylpropionate/trans-cinnamate dioxygenase ferredoxin reductase subunit